MTPLVHYALPYGLAFSIPVLLQGTNGSRNNKLGRFTSVVASLLRKLQKQLLITFNKQFESGAAGSGFAILKSSGSNFSKLWYGK